LVVPAFTFPFIWDSTAKIGTVFAEQSTGNELLSRKKLIVMTHH